LDEFVSFLVAHVNDSRVANPEVRDAMMQQLNFFLVCGQVIGCVFFFFFVKERMLSQSTSRFGTAAAQNETAQTRLLPLLMTNANRNWVAVRCAEMCSRRLICLFVLFS
jgi:hypothetical protein